MNHSACVQDPPIAERAMLPNQQKTILVVDDEPLILHLMREILEDIGGYNVIMASTSREALLLAARQDDPSHLLVLDYMLFGSVNGIELYDLLHAREGWQGVPCIIASCNAPQDEVRQRNMLHLAKPFALEQLLALVAAALVPQQVPVGNR